MCYQFEFDTHMECMDEMLVPRTRAMCVKGHAMHDRRQTCAECREVAGGLTGREPESFEKTHIEMPVVVS